MGGPPHDDAARGACLSQALKAIRRRRGLRAADVAARLGMPLRSYEHFEAGRGRLNVDRIHRFAEVVDADPYAILAAVEIGSPRFAVRCADDKLMAILMMAIQDFDASAGDDIAGLDPRTLISAFAGVFDQLAAEGEARRAALGHWRASQSIGGSGTDGSGSGC